MKEVNIKSYRQYIADEMNKDKLIVKMFGKIDKRDVWHLHNGFLKAMLRSLYSHYPFIFRFGKHFAFFSKPKEVIDKYRVDNKQKITVSPEHIIKLKKMAKQTGHQHEYFKNQILSRR